MWEQINRLYLFVQKRRRARKLLTSSPHEFFKRVVTGSHLFQGITDATMTHGEGWDFIRIGTLLERADCTFAHSGCEVSHPAALGRVSAATSITIQWMAVLKSCSALEAYCKLYVGQVAPWKVAEFLHHPSANFRARSVTASTRWMPRCHRISGVDESRFGERSGAALGPAALGSSIT